MKFDIVEKYNAKVQLLFGTSIKQFYRYKTNTTRLFRLCITFINIQNFSLAKTLDYVAEVEIWEI